MDKGSNKLKQTLPNAMTDASDNNSLLTTESRTDSVDSAFDDKMPQTCCSTCQTVFEVSPELLASSDTRVRCGECLSIFDALINLRKDRTSEEDSTVLDEDGIPLDAHEFLEQSESDVTDDYHKTRESASHTLAADPQQIAPKESVALDLTHTEYDLFSGKAELPDVAYFDLTQEMDSLNFDEPDGDETFGDEIFAHDLTMGPTVAISPPVSGDATLDTLALDSNVDFVTDEVPSDPVVFNYRDSAPDTAPRLQDQPVAWPA